MFMSKPNTKRPLVAVRTVSNPAWTASPAPRDGTPSAPPTPASAGQQASFDLSAKASWKVVTKLIGDLISAQQELAKVETELTNITALQAHTEGLPNYTTDGLLLRASALQSKKIALSSRVDSLSESIAEKFLLASNGLDPTTLEEVNARIAKIEQAGPTQSNNAAPAASNGSAVDAWGDPIDTPSQPPPAQLQSATSSTSVSSAEIEALKYEFAKQRDENEKLRAQLCNRMDKLERHGSQQDHLSASGRTPMHGINQPRQASVNHQFPPVKQPPIQRDEGWGAEDLSRAEPPEMQQSGGWDDEPSQPNQPSSFGGATQYAASGSGTDYRPASPQLGGMTPGPPEMMQKPLGSMTPGHESQKAGHDDGGLASRVYVNRKLQECATFIKMKEKQLIEMIKIDRRKAKNEINGIGQSLNSLQHKLGYNVLNTKPVTLRSSSSSKNLAASVARSATTPADETPSVPETPAVPETPLDGAATVEGASNAPITAAPEVNGVDKPEAQNSGQDTVMNEGEETQQTQNQIDTQTQTQANGMQEETQPTQTQTQAQAGEVQEAEQADTQLTQTQDEPASKKRKRAASVGMSVASDSTSPSAGPAKAGTLVHTVEKLLESVDELKRGHLESEQSAVDLLNTVTATRTLIRELDGRIEVLEDDFDKAKMKGAAVTNGVSKEGANGMDVDANNLPAPTRRGVSAVMLDDVRESLETQLRQVRSNLESAINDLEKDKTLVRRVDAVEKQVSHLETDLANHVARQTGQAEKVEKKDKLLKEVSEKVEWLNKQMPKDATASKKSQEALQEKVTAVDAQMQGITDRFTDGDDRLLKLEQKWDEISPNLNIVTRFMASQVEDNQY